MNAKHALFLSCGFLLLACAGCAHTDATRFYLLQPLRAEGLQGEQDNRYLYGVGPVELAEYLDREQIANRIDDTEMEFSEFDRWAEPLDICIVRVLAENLSVLLNTERVEVFPWRPSLPVDYQVRVRVARFDGTTGDEAVLVAYWNINGKEDAQLLDRKSVIIEKAELRGFDGLVKAQNRALEKLSREIADALKKIQH